MVEDDLDAADRITRLAFGTYRGLPDPGAAFGDTESVRTRFKAAPDCAWVAEVDGEVVGSVLAARWGSFGFFGPLAVHPEWWDRGVGSRLLEPVLEAFERWEIRQAGLFTFANSPKHLGLYQKHGFWPGFLTAVPGSRRALESAPRSRSDASEGVATAWRRFARSRTRYSPVSTSSARSWPRPSQGLGDTVLLRDNGRLAAMAICHRGAGSEAGSGVCYVKFGAVRPGAAAAGRFDRLLDACEAFAADSGRSASSPGSARDGSTPTAGCSTGGFRPDPSESRCTSVPRVPISTRPTTT